MAEENTIPFFTKEDVTKELKRWISTGSDVGSKNFYRKAIEDIESKLNRPLSCLELTWFQRQYVITLLQLWLKKSLGKAFEYLNDEKNDVSQYMSVVLTQLNFINSFEDIRSIPPNDVESTALFNCWCDRDCGYLQLIFEQEDLFKNTPRFTAFVNCYLKQFKFSCIEKTISRCLNDIVTDKTNGEKHKTFIANLNLFLSKVNEEKNFKDIVDKDEFLIHYVKDENKTGRDIIKQLVEKFNSGSETEQEGRVAAKPEWLQTFLSNANSINLEDEWSPSLQLLTKEICKKFLLPETDIKFKEEDGKEIICITGVVIFISQMIVEMSRLKDTHPDVEEIKIVGLQSVHIDCDLDNDTWHGINIGITTDKLIVDDPVNDGSFCWNVSGEKADDQLKGKRGEPGESGGNVHVVCNQIINGQKWTIVSDGGNGSDGQKWTKEEFENSFPSMSTDDNREAMKTVLTTLKEILPKENRKRGQDILPGHEGNFLIDGTANDGSEITATFYEEQSLIFIQRSHIVGQGGYGGDITVECFNPKESSRTEVPFAGTDTRRKPLTNVRMGVYEASGSNGETGKVKGDVAVIHHKVDSIFFGFDKDISLKIRMDAKYAERSKNIVKYEDRDEKGTVYKYARVNPTEFRINKNTPVKIMVDALKKNAVIRRGLVQHLDQINEWNQLMKFIQNMLSNPKEHRSSRKHEIINEMDNKVHQFHQLTTQRQQKQINQQYVKPAIDSSSRSLAKPKIIGRRPVDSTQSDVCCLDILSAENGVDSLFHCLFGKINPGGKYVCKNTKQIRLKIARKFSKAFHREKRNTKPNDDGSQQKMSSYNLIGNFASRVQDYKRSPRANDKIKENIQRVVDEYSPHDDEDFLDANDDEKWKNAWNCIQNENDLYKTYRFFKRQYAKFIESPTSTMGLAELQILAEILDITIHVYKNGQGSFHHRKTLKKKRIRT